MADKNSDIDLRRLFRSVRRLKWLYLASAIVFLVMAVTYCLVKQPQYQVRSTIMIEDSSDDAPSGAGGMAAMMKTFSIGGFGASSVDNELQLINSHDVLMRTAKALSLNRSYFERDGLRKRMLFEDSPIRVDGSDKMFDTLTHAMKMRVRINGQHADISVKTGMLGRVIAEERNVSLPATVATPYGALIVSATDAYTGSQQTVDVSIGSYPGAADFLEKDISVDKADKLSDAISFEMSYPNRERGMAILNVLMNEYNAKRLNRKHATANTELEFLDERIASIFDELSRAEDSIRDFKTRNNAAAFQAEAPLIVENALSTQAELVKAQAESNYLKEILASLDDPTRRDGLLPVFDNEAYPMIKDYNDMVIEKRQLEKSARQGNPALEAADENLRQMRISVINNVEGMLDAANALIKSQSGLVGTANSRIKSLPQIERDYVMLERDRQLKNSLYMYLVDKRESALLQLYSQNTLGFVVDEAYCALKPSKKKAIIVCLLCLFMAVFCPSVVAIWITLRNNRVIDPMDLAKSGLERHTFTNDGSDAFISDLRDKLMDAGTPVTVYTTGDCNDILADRLRESFDAIDVPATVLSTSTLGLPATNDSLRRSAFTEKLAGLAASVDVVIIPVPDINRISVIKPLISRTNTYLVFAISRNTVSRTVFSYISRTFGRCHTYVAIMK